ncbi:MAG TPA: phosphatase PAP2 family protein [Thermoanaerobaculia bacterium]|nr:phosphatase PAP2 family protein [Thermoanaerobaculia bacterium]
MRFRPIEAIHFAALAALTGLALLLFRRIEDPKAMLLGYAGLAALVAVVAPLASRADRMPWPVAFFVDFYSAAFIPLLFNTLEPLIQALRGGPHDEWLIAADRALFGVDVTVWAQRFVRPALNDLFYSFYSTYYFIALTLALVLWLRDRATARRFVFTLMVVYYVSWTGYFIIPALGPRFAQAAEYTVSLTTTPIARTINDTINSLEKTKFDVFPSGHTMISVAVLIVAWRRARDVFWILLPIAAGLVISTVYCRFHYVIDVIAGMTLAFVTVPVGDGIYDRLTAAQASATRGTARPVIPGSEPQASYSAFS